MDDQGTRHGLQRARTVLCLLLAVLGAGLLVAGDRLPVPRPYHRAGAGTTAGWVLVGTAAAVEALARARTWRRRRRARAWRSAERLDRAADALAEVLASRYAQDGRSRISGPKPIAVTWSYTGGTHAPAPDADTSTAAGYFRAVPHGRLVVLGGAGAGKTFLALALARDLLAERAKGRYDRVPAVLPLASWDPEQGLLAWAAAQLAAAHPEACTPVPGAPPDEVALHLLRSGRMLPVLDGFDELPEPARADAFQQIAETLRETGRPFVLTSRGPAYRKEARKHRTFQRTEVTLDGLTSDALEDYLGRDRPSGEPWDPVLKLLRAGTTREARRLRRVLRVPLMVELARVAYGTGDTYPVELVKPGRFTTRRELERHLYEAFLDVVYSDARDDEGRWGRRSARRWTEHLARRMRDGGHQEFAWWRLDEELPRPVRAVRYVPAFAVMAWVFAGPALATTWWESWVPVPAWAAFLASSVALLLLAGGSMRSGRRVRPHRMVRPNRQAIRSSGPANPSALAGGSAAVLVLVLGWPLTAAAGASAAAAVGRWAMGLYTGFLLLGFVQAVGPLVWRPADPARAASPAALLRSDRRAAVLLGWLVPQPRIRDEDLLFLLLCAPVAVQFLWQVSVGRDLVSVGLWAAVLPAVLLSWTLYSVAVSAWGRFTLARLWLAARGELPGDLLPFLEDAAARGVLRQAGGVYRFRHVELRNRLAETAPDDRRPRAGRARRVFGVLRVPFAVLVAAVLVATLAGPLRGSRLPGPVRAVPDPCALIDGRDVAELLADGAQRPDRDATGMATCAYASRAPFAPDTSVVVSVGLRRGGPKTSGSEKAADEYRRRSASDVVRGDVRRLPRLGDEAYVSVVPDDVAELHLRAGNLLLDVSYGEEEAAPARLTSVAEVLARRALRRAGLDRYAGPPVSLPDAPRPGPPPLIRLAAYDRRAAAGPGLYGATWDGNEPSRLWAYGILGFVFRAPRDLSCVRVGLPAPLVLSCSRPEPPPGRGPYGPDIRIDFAVDACSRDCTRDRTDDAYVRTLPDHKGLRWLRGPGRDPASPRSTTHYAVANAGRTHRMYLLRQFWTGTEPGASPTRRVYWVRVEVPHGHEALAQKVVNDVYGQTGGDTY
ncbi:NACHT domain-containing protein [Streptomyces sp. NPDC086023]|uniref:NACHT domain-containing protein n=1 Tax=Streptomyces sp. NPDC086023 TaxID=3365746 RepID=UPI0037D3821A